MTDTEVSPAAELQAQSAEHLAAKTGEADIYVPVTNCNYLPEGIVRLEGWVPPINGGILDDYLVIGQKVALEDDPLNKLESGPHEDNAWVDPNAEPDEGEGETEPVATSTSDSEDEKESPEPATHSFA